MILALDKNAALFVFTSTQEAERHLEAIDVQQDVFEFCDIRGQRFFPIYTRPPKESRLGLFSVIDIGAFKLVAEGEIDPKITDRFIEQAKHIEHSMIPACNSVSTLRKEIYRQVQEGLQS